MFSTSVSSEKKLATQVPSVSGASRFSVQPEPSELPKAVIYEIAEKITKQLGFEPGGDLFQVVKNLGGTVSYRDFFDPEESDSGSLEVSGRGNFKIYISHDTSEERDRFTIAHELGHYILHYILPKKIGEMKVDRYGSNRIEWEANWFAAAFLMPRDSFVSEYRQLGGNLVKLAKKFKVSLMAARIRSDVLGLSANG
jgi:predicted transcriptional regulator